MKRILALVLGLAMLSALASGCAPTGESGGGQSSPAVSTDSNTSYTIATNNFGAGVYPHLYQADRHLRRCLSA